MVRQSIGVFEKQTWGTGLFLSFVWCAHLEIFWGGFEDSVLGLGGVRVSASPAKT